MRGFSRTEVHGGHISVEPRINERIRVPEVRLVGPNGEQVGIVSVNDALRLAQEADLDLVEVAPTARPPVCKLMDYGKFKYESALKARESRKNQTQTIIKEIKLRPKIDPHDYGTKKGHVERFLKAGDKVKVTIMFRGREQSRPELGFRLLQRLASDVEELGFVEAQPKQDGRNMIMVIGPHKKKSDAKSEQRAAQSERELSRQVPRPRSGPSGGGETAVTDETAAPEVAAAPAAPAPAPAPAAPAPAASAPAASAPAGSAPRPSAPAGGAPRPAPARPAPAGGAPRPSAPAGGAPRPARPAPAPASAAPASPAPADAKPTPPRAPRPGPPRPASSGPERVASASRNTAARQNV